MTRSIALRFVVLAAWMACPASARADFRLERQLDLAPGGRLLLDTDDGRVTVRGGSQDGVRIRITSRRDDIDDRYRFSFESDGQRAVVKGDRRGASWFSWRRDSIEFEIEVPTATSLELETSGGRISVEGVDGELVVDTSGGSIEIVEVRGDVDAHTSGGPIEVVNVAGDLRADTSGGSISVEDVTGDVRAETSGGSIRMEEIGGRVYAHSSGGSVSVRFAGGNAEGGDLSTSGGTVTAYVDRSVPLDIDASTSGGRVSFDITVRGQVSKGKVQGTINGGGESLRLRSSGGNVRLNGI